METLKIDKQNTKMIAHRGLSGLEPENTILAFIAAGNRSYFGIETDVRITKDKKFILCHDDNLKRISGIDVKISDATYEELRSYCLYDFDSKERKEHVRLASLEEYLGICKKYDKVAVIELKEVYREEDVVNLLDTTFQYLKEENVIFISFYLKNLQYIRKYNSNVKIQFLTSDFDKAILNELRKLEAGLDINYHQLSKEIVETCHKYGIEVNVWTVNNPIEAYLLLTWNINYITSNVLE